MSAPDSSFMTLRRIDLASERMETLYTALHLALIIVFVGVMYALYTVRKDVLSAIEGNKS